MIELDLTGPHREDAYRILAGLVTPRPIALTTTVDLEGRVNAAPFSFFNVLGDSPPIVCICPGDRASGEPKDTARNIRLTQEFVVNLVDESIMQGMNLCAASLPPGENELLHAGLTATPSSVVKPPRIAEAPASLECRSHSIIEIGDNRLIIGEVLRVHVREGIFDPDTWLIQPGEYHPIGRMQSPNWYCKTQDLFEMKRPQ
ncbi:NADH-FMN oxidoreductase RutF, flavin reductase (DIM6/NTAB) family [Prosthecobacter debontii]|uniref:NADH-FMN oxidoreductase RutF, flavin reductase (DIM6/NTAB) family n=1 Tax=Prosthecobacter debontii TaxID=48467 RepID=A0A1T4YYI9_9BACT|nr:flavin reductase family protein [Prosthecobacter debontii]SKB06867.1 NADH-FMN oxidoreductase RutF, flavin reductase (DIM6/NTAB) family [Prosthecobacter debontii]